jgi:serine/threonine protein kinase
MSGENRIGTYRLLRTLGEGGMGTVYLGHDDLLDRTVAIKVLRADKVGTATATATMAKRFLREARSAARIGHPNVVTIYTVGKHAQRPYLVMEYVEGGSLADHLRRSGPMDWRNATAAIRDALGGLAAAHGKGVIHRDMKPANLMRARDAQGNEVIKLVDFGLARVVDGPDDSADLTFAGAFIGSPNFASPEQIAGARVIDGRADLYSLAATWFALLTGLPPFVEDDPADVMERHLEEPFPEVQSLARVPGPLVAVLEKASRKRPEDRYANAAEMLQAVDALLALPGDTEPARGRRKRPKAKEWPADARSSDSLTDEETVAQLTSTLAQARACRDSSTQLQTLRRLFGLYARLDRQTEAQRAFREALALHVKMCAPGAN